MTDLSPSPPQDLPSRRRSPALVALAAGSLAGLVLGLGGIASAQEATPTPSESATTAPGTTDPDATTEDSTEDSTDEGSTDEGSADEAARDELCDEPGGDAEADSGTSSTEPASL